MANPSVSAVNDPFGKTERQDAWWIEPLLTMFVLGMFGLYATWVAFQGVNYEWGPYLSPFYSPKVPIDMTLLGVHVSPALFILPFPLLFRASCYYYRKAYYRAFFSDPPACAVGEETPLNPLRVLTGTGTKYRGETAFPFAMWNLHRFALYAAIVFWLFLTYDAVVALWHDGQLHFGLGNVIMLANIVLLALYTFGCHSWRHLVGGNLNCFSCDAISKVQHKAWCNVSRLNEHHMLWAWCSLFSVWLTDVYIRLLSSGVITETPWVGNGMGG